MVRYIQAVFEKSIKFLGKWTVPLVLTILIALAVAAALALILFKMDREALTKFSRKTKEKMSRLLVWILLIAVLLLEMNLMVAVRSGVISRIEQATSAQYTSIEDPGGGSTVQYAPSVAYQETTSRTQRLIIPKNTLNYINAFGVNFVPGWSPEQLRYDTRPIMNIDDQLEKGEKAVVVKRTITLHRFLPLKLKSTDINLKLLFKDMRGGSRRQYYDAEFNGVYTFSNPTKLKRLVHFLFPLPYASGTLSDFRFKVDGREIIAQDVTHGYKWEGELNPEKIVNVEVSYKNKGYQSWTYNLSTRREPIADFRLQVVSDNPRIKFQRGSLFPATPKKSLTGTTLIWELKDQITSQDVSLYFPGLSLSELITRMYIFSPIALVGFVIMLMGFACLKRKNLTAIQIILGSLAYSGGFTITAYLLTYMPLWMAILIAFAMAAILSFKILGREMLPPIILFSLVPLTFVWVGNTGLLLCLIGLGTLGLIAFNLKKDTIATQIIAEKIESPVESIATGKQGESLPTEKTEVKESS